MEPAEEGLGLLRECPARAAVSWAEPRLSLGLKRVPSAKDTDGLFDLAILEVRGMLKGELMSSLLKPDGSKNMLHLEVISWNSPPATASMSFQKSSDWGGGGNKINSDYFA